ncbi:BatA domain-containing protein [Hymenobacter sp. HSC-4F20]|uniref:BatA domain-containing protein n=1 Tax=Hymenobacter sp. HSC-4F20 TaxID=2864135 RepID=UPI002175ABCA|nr:BatA domain-containing protein [Hymenobacter sp. HSC-4F20]
MAFIHPWFLAGLLAIALPIAIHFFELRRPQRLLFSNVSFVREVKIVTASQRRIKHLLILAARIGVISFLVLLFAQPILPAPEAGAVQAAVVNVMVDTSPSMRQLGGDDQTLLENGIREAAELPLAFPATARYTLFPGKPASLGADQYRAAVERLQVSGQVGGGRNQLQRYTSGGHLANGPLFLFSDFQKSTFSAQALREIDTTRQVFLVPLAKPSGANVFVDSVWLDDAFVRQGVDLQVHIRLRNGGVQPASNCQAKLFVGRQQAATFTATVPAQQSVTTQVRIRLASGEVQQCSVQLEEYPVDFDNTYYFTLQPAARIAVVELAAEPRLRQLYTNEPLFSYQQAAVEAPDYPTLAAANLLVLREAASISGGVRENLRRAVNQGATLVVVPAAGAAGRDSYNRLFQDLGVGPVQWQPQGTKLVLQEVATPGAQNPFFRDVFATSSQRAGMPKAAPILRWSRSESEVLRMRDGEPFLAGFRSGKGMVYVFAAPLSDPYSDFMQHPLFVPVMYRLAMQSYQQEQQPAYRLTQQTLTLRLPESANDKGSEPVYRLAGDSLTYIPAQRRQGGTLFLEVPPGMQQSGFYTLQRNNKPVATLAFNFDKRESDLRSYSAAELRELIGPNRPTVHVYETSQGQTVAAHYKATRVGVPLWRYCLWAALACLLLEGLLLRWNRRGASVPEAVAA